jgi:hypothetical protein
MAMKLLRHIHRHSSALFVNSMKNKISLNWGTGITLTYSVFALAILCFVVFSFRQKIDLVSTDYYAKELAYQQHIDATENSQKLAEKLVITSTGKELEIHIPNSLRNELIVGELELFCAANASNDSKFHFETKATNVYRIQLYKVKAGRYTAKLKWNQNGKAYYTEQIMVIP